MILGYFVFFVEKGVIEAHDILEYYRTRVSGAEREIESITKMG